MTRVQYTDWRGIVQGGKTTGGDMSGVAKMTGGDLSVIHIQHM